MKRSQERRLRNIQEALGDLKEIVGESGDQDLWPEYEDDPVGFIHDILISRRQKREGLHRTFEAGVIDPPPSWDPDDMWAGDWDPNDYDPCDEPYPGWGLWSALCDISSAVAEETRVAVQSCNGTGKDWLAARLALWWVYAVGGRVVALGPKKDPLKKSIVQEMKMALDQSQVVLPGKRYEMGLQVEHKREILAMTARTPSSLKGHHGPRVMCIITEAQGVESKYWQPFFTNAVGEHDRKLVYGNPDHPIGPFYQKCNSETWHTIQIAADEHPNVKQQRGNAIPGAVTQTMIDEHSADYGPASDEYRSAIKGEFPQQSEHAVISAVDVEQAQERYADLEESGSHEERIEMLYERELEEDRPWWAHRYVLGVDTAQEGSDKNVVAVRRGSVIEEFRELPGGTEINIADQLESLMKELGFLSQADADDQRGGRKLPLDYLDLVIVDAVTTPDVSRHLRDRGYNAADYKGSGSPRDTDRFGNKRAEAFWQLSNRLQEEGVALPDHDRMKNDLTVVQRRWDTHDGKIWLTRKPELRKKLGRSTDYGDAAVMAFYDHNVDQGLRGLFV